MKKALGLAAAADEKSASYDLIKVLTGEKKASYKAEPQAFVNTKLNDSQQQAVGKILSSNELALVHGPPGTGKTTTLIQAIKALIETGWPKSSGSSTEQHCG